MSMGDPSRKRKLLVVDRRVLQALDALSRERGVDLDALADEAFRDLLKRHRRPASLKEALRESARTVPANDPGPRRTRTSRTS